MFCTAHSSISDQLGARFDDIRKSAYIKGVVTFNSTKKKMGICFTVSNRCNFVTSLMINKKCGKKPLIWKNA